MRFFIYTNDNELKESIKRYFYYVINFKFKENNNVISERKKDVVLVYERFEFSKRYIKNILNLNEPLIFLLGLEYNKNDNYINLVNLNQLKNKLEKILGATKIESKPKSLIFVKEINKQVNKFFKSHGQGSLLNGLNNAKYYFNNGIKEYNKNKFSKEDFIKVFVNPGLESWQTFKRRLDKYKDYLLVLGFKEEVKSIEDKTSNFQEFVERIKNIEGSEVKNMDDNKLEQNINFIDEIVGTLHNIKQVIDEYKK